MALLDVIPEQARELADALAVWCGIDRGRITLVINGGRVVDGFVERRFGATELARYAPAGFCNCRLDTSTVHGLCVVCRLPKQADAAV